MKITSRVGRITLGVILMVSVFVKLFTEKNKMITDFSKIFTDFI